LISHANAPAANLGAKAGMQVQAFAAAVLSAAQKRR
jgi:hypothetical protein